MLRITSLKFKGFTLIEILIVMFIIGIIFTFITISIHVYRADELKLKNAVYRLYTALIIAQDLAKLNNKHYAVLLLNHHYQLYSLESVRAENYQWQAVALPQKFARLRLTPDIHYQFAKQPKTLLLFNLIKIPDIIFYTDGTFTPFRVILYIEKPQRISMEITGNSNGEIQITQPQSVSVK